MKTDTELEALLRATLATHAQDVHEAASVRQVTELLRRARRWLPALVAAAVVVAVAIAVSVATGGRAGRTHQPVRPSPSTTTIVSPPPAAHVNRQVSLSSVSLRSLPGWVVHLRASSQGHRIVTVRKASDQDAPIGCNGCEMASDYIYVFDRGKFSAQQDPVHNAQQVDVSGHSAQLGTASGYSQPRYQVPTVAWQFAPGRWALVQGVTPAGGATDALLAVARAVEPAKAAPLDVPYRFGYVPDLPVTDVVDDRAEGYAFTISFGNVNSREFDVTLWPNGSGVVKQTPANGRLVGGLPAYYDPETGVADVPLPHGYLELGIGEGSTEAGASIPLTETDRTDMARVLDELRWTNGDGSEPFVSAEQAIP